MKYLTVVAVVAILIVAISLAQAQLDESIQNVIDSCRSNVSEEEFQLMNSAMKDPSKATKNIRCFAKCLMDGWGLMKDGEFDEDEFIRLLTRENKDDEEEGRKVAAFCSKQVGVEECEKEYKIFLCMNHKKTQP